MNVSDLSCWRAYCPLWAFFFFLFFFSIVRYCSPLLRTKLWWDVTKQCLIITWSHFRVSAFASFCSSRRGGARKKTTPEFTLLGLINNLSIPCSSLFHLNDTQRDLFDHWLCPEGTQTQRKHKKNQNNIIQKKFFDLDWMNNEVVPQKKPNGSRVGRLLIDGIFFFLHFLFNVDMNSQLWLFLLSD